MATVNEQLIAAIKAAEEAVKLVELLKKQTRDADLATVKELITRVRQLGAQVIDFIELGVKTCPYKRLICCV